MDRELLIVAAAVALVFALPVAMLCWMAAQWAHGRAAARRLDGLEEAVRQLMEERQTAAPDPALAAASAALLAGSPVEAPEDEADMGRLDDDFDVATAREERAAARAIARAADAGAEIAPPGPDAGEEPEADDGERADRPAAP